MKLLVIEDELKIAQALKQGLLAEGYVVDIATDGLTGYDMLSSEPYDVIILDIMLPEMSGTEICKRARAAGNIVPILMLTARSELDDKVEGLNIGADDYLTKPFAFEELLARLKALARRPKIIQTEILNCGNLKLDPLSGKVVVNSLEISLSKTECALLETFMRNPSKVMSKEFLIAKVWPFDSDVLENTLEQYIRYLREKLGGSFIKTVRGFGYMLICSNQQE